MSVFNKEKKTVTAPELPEGMNQPFYVNTRGLESTKREYRRTLDNLNITLYSWNSVTEFEITDISALQDMVADPAAYYVRRDSERNTDRNAKLKQTFQGLDFNKFLTSVMEWPAGFDSVQQAARKIGEINWEYFTVDGGRVELSQAFFLKACARCYFYVETKEQKARLAFAQALIKTLEQQAQVMADDPALSQAEIDALDHIGPVPTALRIEREFRQGKYYGKLLVNEKWVTFGHRQARQPVDRKENYTQYRAYYRTNEIGLKEMRYFNPADPSVPQKFKDEIKSHLLPNWFHVIGGRLVDSGKPA